jgi:hypothetical protein
VYRDQPSVIGGFPVGADGRVHTIFTHNPSSLRLSSTDPNLQNLPRGNDSAIQKMVKEMFIAPDGWTFWARDYSGIEAVLVGYFASSHRYVRAAKLGVHAFLAGHIAGRPFDFKWSDADIKQAIKEIKKDKIIYDTAKRVVHGSNYMMTPRKMQYEYPETFPTVAEAYKLQGLYFDIFPEIRQWHSDLCSRVDGTKLRSSVDVERVDPWTLGVCHARNPFGYTHRFYNVLDWEAIEYEGKTEWVSSFGDDAKRLVSFLPQSTAAAIIKRATKRIWYDFPWIGQTLRLLIHDEIFGETKEEDLDQCLEISRVVMEEPIPELPLDPSWGMGEYLSIGTEPKVGKTWATMH